MWLRSQSNAWFTTASWRARFERLQPSEGKPGQGRARRSTRNACQRVSRTGVNVRSSCSFSMSHVALLRTASSPQHVQHQRSACYILPTQVARCIRPVTGLIQFRFDGLSWAAVVAFCLRSQHCTATLTVLSKHRGPAGISPAEPDTLPPELDCGATRTFTEH